jgi:hypothetical protein
MIMLWPVSFASLVFLWWEESLGKDAKCGLLEALRRLCKTKGTEYDYIFKQILHVITWIYALLVLIITVGWYIISGKQKRLLTIDSRCEINLNDRRVPNELQQKLYREGILTSSRNMVVQIHKKDQKWLVIDKNDMQIYSLEKRKGIFRRKKTRIDVY